MAHDIPNPVEDPQLAAFRRVPRTGVIFVTVEAGRAGFRANDPEWCNLGQGQPDTAALPGAPERLTSLSVDPADLDYAPVPGLPDLRAAVADLYNRIHRRGMRSQYAAENVAICGGGRVSIMRACAAVGPIHLGHFLPDYTAYEELLDVFRRFQPIPLLLDPESAYAFSTKELRKEILGLGLGGILMSNACNPTGKLVAGEELAEWLDVARELRCAMLFDEFYSHYVWEGPEGIVSAARYVEDVNRDPVLVFDGLTKNWRYPGFRTSWVLGPKEVIESISSAGSFLDGGGSAPLQRAAIDLVQYDATIAETEAIRASFAPKRRFLVDRLKEIGVRFNLEPQGTFYAWGDLGALPPSIRDSDDFFRKALERKVICVPGHFFDVNPGKRRIDRPSRFRGHVRFSFGPEQDVLERALERLAEMVREEADAAPGGR